MNLPLALEVYNIQFIGSLSFMVVDKIKKHLFWLPAGADTGFQKGGEGSGLLLSTKTWHFHVHMRNVFSLFMKFGGPRKGGGGS